MARSTARRPDRSAALRTQAGDPGERRDLLPNIAWTALAAAVVAWIVLVAPQAARAVLNTDECFHAHAAQWIAAHGTLPTRMPELYGGFPYYYPPLLHLLGAAWVKVAGVATLPLLNVVLFGLMVLALSVLPVPGLASTARRWALWLVIATHGLAVYAMRFYTEMLTCLLVLLVVLLLLRFDATRRMRDAVLLGIAGGLAMLAKNTALLIPVALVIYGVAQAVTRRSGVRAVLVAAVITLAIAAPMLIRNQVLFGSPVYPAGAPNMDAWIYRLNQETFAGDLRFYLNGVWQTNGPWALGIGVIGLGVALLRRRWDLHTGLLVTSVAGIALAPLSPLHDARHVMPLIAVMALSGSVVIHDALASRSGMRAVLEYGFAALALVGLVTLGNRRTDLDVPPGLMSAYARVHELVPAGDTVLSLWTYDTFYHSGRAATWPIPWGQGARSPAALFRETDPDRFAAEMDRLGIGWILMPRHPGAPRFNGANYPRTFVTCLSTLLDRRAVRIAWGTDELTLVQRIR